MFLRGSDSQYGFSDNHKAVVEAVQCVGRNRNLRCLGQGDKTLLRVLGPLQVCGEAPTEAALNRPADSSNKDGPTHRQLELIVMGHIMRGIKNQQLVAKVLPYKRPYEVWHAVKPPSSQHNEEDLVAQLRALRFSDFRSLDDYLAQIYKLRNAIWRNKSGRDRVPEQEVLRTIVAGLPKEVFREVQLEFFRQPNRFTLDILEHRLYEQVEFEEKMAKNDVQRS